MNEKILWAEEQFGLGIIVDDKHYISEKTFTEKCKICGKEVKARYMIVNGYGFFLCEDCREVISTLSHIRGYGGGLGRYSTIFKG